MRFLWSEQQKLWVLICTSLAMDSACHTLTAQDICVGEILLKNGLLSVLWKNGPLSVLICRIHHGKAFMSPSVFSVTSIEVSFSKGVRMVSPDLVDFPLSGSGPLPSPPWGSQVPLHVSSWMQSWHFQVALHTPSMATCLSGQVSWHTPWSRTRPLAGLTVGGISTQVLQGELQCSQVSSSA